MANAVPERACWAQQLKFNNEKLADQVKQNAEDRY